MLSLLSEPERIEVRSKLSSCHDCTADLSKCSSTGPNIPVYRYGCRVVVIFASVTVSVTVPAAVFQVEPASGPKLVWRSQPLHRKSASLHLSPPIFMSSLAPPGARAEPERELAVQVF